MQAKGNFCLRQPRQTRRMCNLIKCAVYVATGSHTVPLPWGGGGVYGGVLARAMAAS